MGNDPPKQTAQRSPTPPPTDRAVYATTMWAGEGSVNQMKKSQLTSTPIPTTNNSTTFAQGSNAETQFTPKPVQKTAVVVPNFGYSSTSATGKGSNVPCLHAPLLTATNRPKYFAAAEMSSQISYPLKPPAPAKPLQAAPAPAPAHTSTLRPPAPIIAPALPANDPNRFAITGLKAITEEWTSVASNEEEALDEVNNLIRKQKMGRGVTATEVGPANAKPAPKRPPMLTEGGRAKVGRTMPVKIVETDAPVNNASFVNFDLPSAVMPQHNVRVVANQLINTTPR